MINHPGKLRNTVYSAGREFPYPPTPGIALAVQTLQTETAAGDSYPAWVPATT
jgi:hypothetical protein